MTKTLEKAFAEAANLPEAAQEQIARDLLTHIRKLQALRADIEKGIRSLDAGKGRELDIEEISEARAQAACQALGGELFVGRS